MQDKTIVLGRKMRANTHAHTDRTVSYRLCAYAGLAPRVHQSANKSLHGPLNINRRKHLQWILLEVVLHFAKSDEKLKKKFDELAVKKNFNTAKVIFARQMLKIIYHILKEKRPFFK
ncbi:MAG: transposase [bacterium]